MITFKCLRGLAPSYLADVCIPISSVVGRWQLRSADSGTLVATIGERDFSVSGPATWNSLPVELRTSSLSTQTFAQKLKTHLFGCERLWSFCLIGAILSLCIHSFIHSFNHCMEVGGQKAESTRSAAYISTLFTCPKKSPIQVQSGPSREWLRWLRPMHYNYTMLPNVLVTEGYLKNRNKHKIQKSRVQCNYKLLQQMNSKTWRKPIFTYSAIKHQRYVCRWCQKF